MTGDVFRCGHEKTPENTYATGRTGPICRTCQLAAVRAWRRRQGIRERGWLGRLILDALRRHPAGLRLLPLWAKIGYRSTPDSVRVSVGYLRRRQGVPIEVVREGNYSRYRLWEER